MYALVISILLMTGDIRYLNSTYYNTEYTCNIVNNLVITELNKDPEIFEAEGKCLKIPEYIEKKELI